MNYETAKLFLADAVAADPFNMEHFRKYGFWAVIVIGAAKNGKANAVSMANKGGQRCSRSKRRSTSSPTSPE